MYQALYRKYRPSDFSGVSGQPHIVQTLRNQIVENRLSHAYLFTGSRGTGKTSCAKIFAKAVNCLNPNSGDPCNECEVCRGINNETIYDITEIDAASNNGVDDIRELRENTAFSPAVAKYRVYIIDEVHMLSGAAFNALLKTLEEPPQHVIFILATTEVHKLPATILSRCQRFDFRRISPEDIASRLMFVAKEEDFVLEQDAALLIAKLSDGALRDALSLLDVCAAGENNVTEQIVINAAGLSGDGYLLKFTNAIIENNVSDALETIDELYIKSKDLVRLCGELIGHCRDLMLIKSMRKPENMIVCSQSELNELQELCDKMTLDAILHALDVFEDAFLRMNRGANNRTALEGAFIKLCNPALDTSPAALLRRISALEDGDIRPIKPASKVEKPVVEKTAREPVQIEDKPVADQVDTPKEEETDDFADPSSATESCDIPDGEFEQWADVLSVLSSKNRLLWAALGGSKSYVKDDMLLLDFENASFRDMINNDPRHKASLKSAITSVTGKKFRIGPYIKPTVNAVAFDPLDKIIDIAKEKGL